jgi:hypothetical protein
VELRDFSFRFAKKLAVKNTVHSPAAVCKSIAQILGFHYDDVSENHVVHLHRTDVLRTARRGTCAYSEMHMGYGECRIHGLVSALEALPEKSLVLLEEPEISLHQAAQFRFGEYLIDLVNRRGHQIALTTHSEHLLRALPQESRVLLVRSGQDIRVLPGLASAQAASLMTDGLDRALTVLVEDDVAASILAELLDRTDVEFRKTVGVVVAGYRDDRGQSIGGGAESIKAALKTFRVAGLRVAAVLDADKAPDLPNFVFRLPGAQPPEKEIFASAAVRQHWGASYALDADAFCTGISNQEHHQWFLRLSEQLGRSEEFLSGEAARVYVLSLPIAATENLTSLLKDASERK